MNPIHVLTAKPIRHNFLWQLTDPREGLWIVKEKKYCPEKMSTYHIFENAPILTGQIRENLRTIKLTNFKATLIAKERKGGA